jgi:hypothetical protein
LSGINKKNEKEKNEVRKKLYNSLLPFYERTSNILNIRQLHFHLADNTSFLRFHKPEKFGDDLTGYIRFLPAVAKFDSRYKVVAVFKY